MAARWLLLRLHAYAAVKDPFAKCEHLSVSYSCLRSPTPRRCPFAHTAITIYRLGGHSGTSESIAGSNASNAQMLKCVLKAL